MGGAGAGARVVVLDGSGAVLPLGSNALDAPLVLVGVPAGRTLDDVSTRQIETVYAGVEYRPLSPVHLKARWQAGGLALSWIRRTRLDGDAWGAGEVPLGEAEERYRVEVRDGENALLWEAEPTTPSILVPSATADALPSGAYWRLAQISARTGTGRWAQAGIPALL